MKLRILQNGRSRLQVEAVREIALRTVQLAGQAMEDDGTSVLQVNLNGRWIDTTLREMRESDLG